MKHLIALALLAAAPALRAAGFDPSLLPKTYAVPVEGDRMEVTVHRLENGLTVYLSPNRELPRVSAWIAVRAGGQDDPSDSTGMAHYLEHMLFKGSRRLGTLDYEAERPHLERISALYDRLFKTDDAAARKAVYDEIDRANLQVSTYAIPNELDRLYKALGFTGINAFTGEDMTVYVSELPKNRLEAWARLESDRFERPVFRLFQQEIETVFEEKNRSLDNPGRILHEALAEALYGGHPYARTVLGSIEHLKNPSLAKMYAFYDRWYAPNNMAVVLAGDFDREEALETVRRSFGRWTPRAVARERRAPPPPAGERRVEVRYEAEEQVQLAWRTVPNTHPDRHALAVLDMLMDNSEAGILNLDLNQAQKVKSSGSYPDFMNDAGSWNLWAVPKKDQTLEQAEALLLGALEKLKAGDFSEDDIRAILTDFEIGEKMKLESNAGRVSEMADAFLSYLDWAEAAKELEALKRVTKADVLRVAKAYLGKDRVVVLRRKGKPELPSIEKPSFTKLQIDPSRQSAFFRELSSLPAEPIEPRFVKEGRDYRSLKRPWGRLIAAKNPMNDLFQLTLSFDRGWDRSPRLCHALELWDLAGAGELGAEELKKRLYALGTKMKSFCSERESGFSLSGLEPHLEESLRLLRLRLARPRLEADTLAKMVEVELGRRRDNLLNPGSVYGALSSFAERGAESPHLRELTDDELLALTEAELVAELKGIPAYRRTALYVGSRGAEEAAELLTREGEGVAGLPERRPLRYPPVPAPKLVFAHKEMVQAQLGLFAPDAVVDPADWTDYQFYGQYMGGGMNAVFFQEVREARSLAYSAGGGYGPGGRKGDQNELYAYAATQADKAPEAAELLKSLLHRLPASADRFETTRSAIIERYRTDPMTFRQIPGAVQYWTELGLKADPRPKRLKEAEGYRLKDLERFARKFEGRPLTLYVLGHRDRVGLEKLQAHGPLEERTVESLFSYGATAARALEKAAADEGETVPAASP